VILVRRIRFDEHQNLASSSTSRAPATVGAAPSLAASQTARALSAVLRGRRMTQRVLPHLSRKKHERRATPRLGALRERPSATRRWRSFAVRSWGTHLRRGCSRIKDAVWALPNGGSSRGSLSRGRRESLAPSPSGATTCRAIRLRPDHRSSSRGRRGLAAERQLLCRSFTGAWIRATRCPMNINRARAGFVHPVDRRRQS